LSAEQWFPVVVEVGIDHADRGWIANIERSLEGRLQHQSKTEIKRQAQPLLDLKVLIGMLPPNIRADARDRALLTLGWAAALRRSELVGLDWKELGGGSGFVRSDDCGITLTLMTSKASQDQAESIVIPSLICQQCMKR
jgi:hypothetical protein